MFVCRSLLLFALSFGPAAVQAAEQPIRIDVDQFAARRVEIETALADPNRYSELTRTQREDVRIALDRMQATLAQADSIEALHPDARSRLFDDQERINSLFARVAADSRLTCKRERRMGSNMAVRRCRTVGEIRRERETSQEGGREATQPHSPAQKP